MFEMKVRDFSYMDRHFVLGKLQGRYVAIEDKYIDEDGRCNTRLNGLQMHASTTLEACMESVKFSVRVDDLVDKGMDTFEAIKKVANL